MSIWKRFLSNSFVLSITEILNKGFPFIIIIFIIRFLGVEANGQFAASLALAGLFIIFSDLGLATLLIRDISRDHSKASRYLSSVLTFKLTSSLIIFVIAGITIYFTKDFSVFYIYLLGLLYIFIDNTNINVFQGGLRAISKVNQEALSKLVRGFTLLVGGLLGVFVVKSIYGVLGFYILSGLTQSVVCVYFLNRQKVKLRLRFHFREWLHFLKHSKQFFVNQMLAMVYYSIDLTMLSYMKGDFETGLYNSAYIFFGGFYALGSVLNMAVFPLFSKAYVESKKQWRSLYKKVATFAAVFSILGGIFLALTAPLFLPFIIKNGGVDKAVLGLRILSLGLLFSFQNTIFGALFNSSHNEKKIVIPVLLGTLVNVALNLIFIPYYGLYGAAAATVVTEFTVFCSLFYFYFFQIRKTKQ